MLVRAKQSAVEPKSKIEAMARRVLSEEKKVLEKWRVKGVVPTDDDEVASNSLESRERCRTTAQRGVVKLFNMARAAQIKLEEESRVVKSEEIVGIVNREKKGMTRVTITG